MLKDEQAAELLRRCERIFGRELPEIRGNLRKAETRAAYVWELLVIEAASHIGTVEYEPLQPNPSPDIRLHLPQGRTLWIEVAYLHPRFWEKERQSQYVLHWLHEEAKRRGIPAWKIKPHLDGDRGNKAGPVRRLPYQQEGKRFLKEPEIMEFFQAITEKPDLYHTCSLSRYTVSISYSPNTEGPFVSPRTGMPFLSSSGLVQDAPKTVEEHAVYTVLRDKAKKHHDVSGPKVICVGSNQSPALLLVPSAGRPLVSEAIAAAFCTYHSLSAAIIFRIDGFSRQGSGELFLNPHARDPLSQEERQLLCTMNLNRWRYDYALQPWEAQDNEDRRRVIGCLTWKVGGGYMEIEIPANVVVDALAGKTSVAKEFGLQEHDKVSRALAEGWVVEACSLKEGNIELGDAAKVVLRLVPTPLSVFWPARKAEETET